MTNARVLLVTGGAGFLGAEVVRRAAERGYSPHLVAREATDRSTLEGVAATWHLADIEDRSALCRAFEQAAAAARAVGGAVDVLHLAARISYRRGERALLWRVNVEGTRNVLAASERVGVRRLCHVSSVVALGPVPAGAGELDDDAPLAGRGLDSAYANTKAESEALVLAAARELDVVVASPAVVFGFSGTSSNSLHFLRRAVRGTLGPLSPPGSLSVVGLEDASEGILRVLEGGVRARRYLLCESAWRLHDLLGLASRLAGRSGPRGIVPSGAWRALVRVAGAVDRVFPSARATPEALALLGMHFRFRARRARTELGWEPRPFEETLLGILARMEPR